LASRRPVVHLFGWDKKFVLPFIDFVGEHFDLGEHRFIVYGKVEADDLPQDKGIIHYPSLLKNLLSLMTEIRVARKIILHGLFSSHLLYVLLLQPWLLKKCYWMIWGGDLYIHQADVKDWRWRKNEWVKRFVVSRLGHFITHIRGDYELAQQWYGAKGQWHECFMYPSNLYREYPVTPKPHDGTNILLGNSATPTNNHLDALEKLRPFAGDDIRIYCPLSYGDFAYGDQIAEAGKAIFGDKFIPLRDFMPFGKYLELLTEIDIAIFNNNRQQGMGNMVTLLGLGKKLFIQNSVTQKRFFEDNDIYTNDVLEFNLIQSPGFCGEYNKKRISSYFSVSNLSSQLRTIFYGDQTS